MPPNETSRQARILKLAALDFAHAPIAVIKQEMKGSYSHYNVMRKDPLYLETVEEMKTEWKAKMLNTPETTEIARTISYALGIATKKLVNILASSKTTNRDVISAARLIAQMDGRFLGRDSVEGEEIRHSADTNSLATELIQAINRHKSSVQ